MSAPETGRPWAAGDYLIRIFPPGWTVPAGWTMASEDPLRGCVVWRRAEESGHGDPDTYVATPVRPSEGSDGTGVRWDGTTWPR